MNIKDWIPQRIKHEDKTAWESPNRHIWVSWGGHPVTFHVDIGPASFMWIRKLPRP